MRALRIRLVIIPLVLLVYPSFGQLEIEGKYIGKIKTSEGKRTVEVTIVDPKTHHHKDKSAGLVFFKEKILKGDKLIKEILRYGYIPLDNNNGYAYQVTEIDTKSLASNALKDKYFLGVYSANRLERSGGTMERKHFSTDERNDLFAEFSTFFIESYWDFFDDHKNELAYNDKVKIYLQNPKLNDVIKSEVIKATFQPELDYYDYHHPKYYPDKEPTKLRYMQHHQIQVEEALLFTIAVPQRCIKEKYNYIIYKKNGLIASSHNVKLDGYVPLVNLFPNLEAIELYNTKDELCYIYIVKEKRIQYVYD